MYITYPYDTQYFTLFEKISVESGDFVKIYSIKII